MRYRYPQPGSQDEFEDFCVRFYAHLLKRDALIRYAKRGELQDGIDIIDQLSGTPLFAIQCKNHEPTKAIPPKEIRDEVALAEKSIHRIDRYIIATTAKRSKKAHDTVLQLNQRPDGERRFLIEIHFWEDICTYLNEFGRAVADFIVYGEHNADSFSMSVAMRTGNHASTARSASDSDSVNSYPAIDELFVSRKLEVAEHEINKLPNPELDATLKVRQRYAILRLKAKLALDKSEYDESVRLFILAYETCPELEQARQNHVLALYLSGKRQQALTEAAKLIDENVRSPFIVTLLVRSSKTPTDLLQYQNIINACVDTDEELNVALVERYLEWNLPELARTAARRAVRIAPDSAHAHLSNGMVAHHAAFQGDWKSRNEHIAEAIAYYTEALAAAERDKFVGLLPEIYLHLGRINALKGDTDRASDGFRNAVRVARDASLYAEPAVSFFLSVEDFESAWKLLPILDSKSLEGQFLTVATEYHHAPRDEKKRLVLSLLKLANRKFDRAVEARFLCVQSAIEIRDFELARKCVSKRVVKSHRFQAYTLLAWIELAARNVEKAREYAKTAFDSSSRTAHRQEVRLLGTILISLDELDNALPLLERATTAGVLDDTCKRLVECARRLNRHDVLIRICAELRLTNQQDNSIRKLEVQVLSHYAPEDALTLANQFRQFDEPYFKVASNYLAMRLGKLDEIHFDDDRLPDPADFSADEAYLVVSPYIETGRYHDALLFAYHQVRLRFSDKQAHGQYIWLVLQYGKKAGLLPPDKIDDQSAIHLENLVTTEKRWVTLEDRQPDSSRNEFSPSTPIGQLLLGHKTGDICNLRGPSVQTQEERIVEIQSKYLRLFQDVIHHFQDRFPGADSIQSIHIGLEDEFDPTAIVESLTARRRHVEKAWEFYQGNLCSLHLLAVRTGVNTRQLMSSLTAHTKWFIRCVECTTEDFAKATDSGLATSNIVLDLTAIVTIARLGAWNQLDTTMRYLVSRTTVDTLSEWLHELTEHDAQPAGYSYLTDEGDLRFQEVSSDQAELERTQVRGMLESVNSLCIVKTSIAIAEMEPARRDRYIGVCGFPTLEALSIAKDERAVLWTDDLLVGVLADVDFGVKRIWSQLAFKLFDGSMRLEGMTYSKITAKLLAWNYSTTVWYPQDIISAGDLCDWDVESWPLKECIRQIGKCPLRLPGKARLVFDIFRLLTRSHCSRFKQSSVIRAALSALGNAPAVQWMLQNVDEFFRIDYPSAEFIKLELSFWLRHHLIH